MAILPFIAGELRFALRKHNAMKSRFHVALICGCIILFYLLIGLMENAASIGRHLHTTLFYFGLFMAVAPAATISVGLFSEERRNQTMELLYLAGVKPLDLFGGKLTGGALVA